MVELVITFLIKVALLIGLLYLIEWVFVKLGIKLPEKVMQAGWVVVVLLIILFAWRAFSGLLLT